MTEASEDPIYLCRGCRAPHNDKGRDFCDACEHSPGHTRGGHIPSQEDGDEWSATMRNATCHILLQTLGITEDTPHRLCDLAAMVARQHTAVLIAGASADRELDFTKDLLTKAIEAMEIQADLIKSQQKTIAQYGGILAKAVERLGA